MGSRVTKPRFCCSCCRPPVAQAGGPPGDPALQQLIALLSPERLPAEVQTRRTSRASSSGQQPDDNAMMVRRGSTIMFSRSGGNTLTASAGTHVLGTVVSGSLCRALFDLYVGDQPVSKAAKVCMHGAMTHNAGVLYALAHSRR